MAVPGPFPLSNSELLANVPRHLLPKGVRAPPFCTGEGGSDVSISSKVTQQGGAGARRARTELAVGLGIPKPDAEAHCPGAT